MSSNNLDPRNNSEYSLNADNENLSNISMLKPALPIPVDNTVLSTLMVGYSQLPHPRLKDGVFIKGEEVASLVDLSGEAKTVIGAIWSAAGKVQDGHFPTLLVSAASFVRSIYAENFGNSLDISVNLRFTTDKCPSSGPMIERFKEAISESLEGKLGVPVQIKFRHAGSKWHPGDIVCDQHREFFEKELPKDFDQQIRKEQEAEAGEQASILEQLKLAVAACDDECPTIQLLNNIRKGPEQMSDPVISQMILKAV